MPEKLAVIHAGFHKTASTSIQHALADHRDLLAAHGYCYPDFRPNGEEFYNRSIPLAGVYREDPENFLHFQFFNDLAPDDLKAQLRKQLRCDIWQRDKLIFSDEFVSTLSPSALVWLRDDLVEHGFQIRVISYIREPSRLLVSMGQQFSRNRPFSIMEAVKRVKFRSAAIGNLQSVFGDSAEFYSFEDCCQHPQGPVGHFFDLIDVPVPATSFPVLNESMSAQAVRIQGHINSVVPRFLERPQPHPLRPLSDSSVLALIPGDKFYLTDDEMIEAKPQIERARQAISDFLGDDFLPEPTYSTSGLPRWSTMQLDYLLGKFDMMDLHILIRVRDYLQTAVLADEHAVSKVEELDAKLRQRLDVELKLNSTLESPSHIGRQAEKEPNLLRRVVMRLGLER